MKLIVVTALLLLGKGSFAFDISIIHFNDFHARFDEQSPTSGVCKDPGRCHGGFSRMYTAITALLKNRKNPILLNAGDNFQGTLWYNLYKWNVTQEFINLLPITANTLGNHEFDDGIEGLTPFLKSMKAPTLVSNINTTLEPSMDKLYNKSMVVEVGGKKIGIVGVIIAKTDEISSTGKVIFEDEILSVNKEATRLYEKEGIFTVVVLSHCGYDIDQLIAKKAVPYISVIVGAHSHTLLYTGTPPDGSRPSGPYPTTIQREIDDKSVYVVQASSYTRYLGDIVVSYDENGDVIGFLGKPIYLSPEMPKDNRIDRLLKPYQEEVDRYGNRIVGETKIFLDKNPCSNYECLLGNFITDAMVYHYRNKKENGCQYTTLAILNAGGFRASIPSGNITYNDLVTCQPFENTLDTGLLKGKHLKEMFEKTAQPYTFNNFISVNLLQVSGFKVVYDILKPLGNRVTSVKVKDVCTSKYVNVEEEKEYRLVIPSFIGRGGDGFSMITENVRNYTKGLLDLEAFMEYLKDKSPIEPYLGDRINFINGFLTKMRKVEV